MSTDHIIKTVTQYNKETIPADDMDKLLAIAKDYCAVKDLVYQRYGGIRSIEKLYPGYDVQNEMNACDIRQQMNMPSVYFNLAVHDATAGIRTEWTRIKNRIQRNIALNDNLSDEDRHYLRYAMKMTPFFAAILCKRTFNVDEEVPENFRDVFREICAAVDTDRLNRYLCRQVRKQHKLLRCKEPDGFRTTKKAYRYGDHGIYISGKQKRQRIFIPLTDSNIYDSQLYIRLFPAEGRIEIKAPSKRRIVRHDGYENTVGIAFGIDTMITTDGGNVYGTELGKLQAEYAEWVREQNSLHRTNPDEGRKKYNRKKNRFVERQHSYINQELNHFIREEKPEVIYLVKLPKPTKRYVDKRRNNLIAMWQRGYIRERLKQKCDENGIVLKDVYGKDIAVECSSCGGRGTRKDGVFTCESCECSMDEKTNTARNTLKRGQL